MQKELDKYPQSLIIKIGEEMKEQKNNLKSSWESSMMLITCSGNLLKELLFIQN